MLGRLDNNWDLVDNLVSRLYARYIMVVFYSYIGLLSYSVLPKGETFL